MVVMYMILQTVAQNSATCPAGTKPADWTFWLMIVFVFAVIWFFMIRPQKKQQKAIEEFRNSLKKGDKVITYGGIYGVVEEVKEKSLLLKVDSDVKLKVDRNSVLKDVEDIQNVQEEN